MTNRQRFGIGMIAAAIALPIVTRYCSLWWLRVITGDHPNPNYGAIFAAYRTLQASVAIGCFLLGAGVVLLIVSRRPKTDSQQLT